MQARAEETRGIVLDTAVTTFGSLGYTNITLADLIARSKVTKGAFYFHFANREAVATAVISETDARLRHVINTETSTNCGAMVPPVGLEPTLGGF